MKQLQEIENNVKAARQRLRRFSVDLQVNLKNRIFDCTCKAGCSPNILDRKRCVHCLESQILIDEAQEMLDDK